jgi:hypothetical protein
MKMIDGVVSIIKNDGLNFEIEHIELVKCKNCKHKDKYENFCWIFLREIDPSDYCSWAERKEK